MNIWRCTFEFCAFLSDRLSCVCVWFSSVDDGGDQRGADMCDAGMMKRMSFSTAGRVSGCYVWCELLQSAAPSFDPTCSHVVNTQRCCSGECTSTSTSSGPVTRLATRANSVRCTSTPRVVLHAWLIGARVSASSDWVSGIRVKGVACAETIAPTQTT